MEPVDFIIEHEHFMARALELALGGRGAVEPNPMVGAVVVRAGQVLGEGRHERFGGPHAEVVAISSARLAGHDVSGSTLYVTLEPCCHTGKTPPCVDAIISAGIAQVVCAVEDVDPRVSGKGFELLRRSGIKVQTGVLEQRARQLLAAYIKLRTRHRPWVICKWAQTPGGLLALGQAGRWISSEQSRRQVHRLRGMCDCICVGIGTVLADDPLLTSRVGSTRQPTRIVLDSRLRIPLDSALVGSARKVPLIIAASRSAGENQPDRVSRLTRTGAEILTLPAGVGGVDLSGLLDELGRRELTYLLVEGGVKVLESFIFGGLADELLVYVSGEVPSANLPKSLPRFDINDVKRSLHLPEIAPQPVGPDRLFRYVLSGLSPGV